MRWYTPELGFMNECPKCRLDQPEAYLFRFSYIRIMVCWKCLINYEIERINMGHGYV